MFVKATKLSPAAVIEFDFHQDNRGWFSRFFCERDLSQLLEDRHIVNINGSFTAHRGSVRGVHFQRPPSVEKKFVRCTKGRVFDVIVDIRQDSPTFLQWFGLELDADDKRMVYVPQGFAHGFQSLEDNCEMLYLHTDFYRPDLEGALNFLDPAINISWPLPPSSISERDKKHPMLDKNFEGLA